VISKKLLGDINWLQLSLGIPNYALQHLFDTLKGDSDISSPRVLSSQAKKKLQILEQYVQQAYVDHIVLSFSFQLIINPTPHSPTGCIDQESDIIIEWVFLPDKENKRLSTYLDKMAQLISKGRQRFRQLSGQDLTTIILPLTNDQIEKAIQENIN
jgi:hypothetical protein